MPFIEIGKKTAQSQPQATDPTTATTTTTAAAAAATTGITTAQPAQTSAYPTLESMNTASPAPIEQPVVSTPVEEPEKAAPEPEVKLQEKPEEKPEVKPEVDEDIREIKGPDFDDEPQEAKLTDTTAPTSTPVPAPAPAPAQAVMPTPTPTPMSAPAVEPSSITPTEPAPLTTPAAPTTVAPEVEKPTTMPAVEEKVDDNQLNPNTTDIHGYMRLALEKNASDIHISVANPVFIRVDGRLQSVGVDDMQEDKVKQILESILTPTLKEELEKNLEADFMYFEESINARFRVNVFYEKGKLAAAFRLIPTKVRTIDELGLPFIMKEFSKIPYGLVLVTGPTGSGKSTTIAAMIEEINRTDPKHIVTIEDPVEYVYAKERSLIAQRSMHYDTKSWNNALRSALRQDPDVVVIGEMRDFETIASAMTIAETGHLVFATLHTNSAAQSIDRIIDVFPEGQQNQVRAQLAGVLSGVISQRLVPLKKGGRKAVIELLIGTVATKNAIREGKTHQIDNIIQTSADVGMQTLEKGLVEMVRTGEIDVETAKEFTTKPEEIDLLLR